MKLIRYENLNAKQKEIYNFQKVAALLADYGFNCIKLADDWQGADFIAYHMDGLSTFRVQLKSRITIDKKYEGKELHVAFPVHSSNAWYLVKHDVLVGLVGDHTDWLNSKSWVEKGHYNSVAPNRQLLNAVNIFKVG